MSLVLDGDLRGRMVGALGCQSAALRAGCGLHVVRYAGRCGVRWLQPLTAEVQPSCCQPARHGAARSCSRSSAPQISFPRTTVTAGSRTCVSVSSSSGNGAEAKIAADTFVLTTPLYYVNAGATACLPMQGFPSSRNRESMHDRAAVHAQLLTWVEPIRPCALTSLHDTR